MLSLPTRPRAGLDSSRLRVCQNLLVDVERGLGYFDLAGFGLGAQEAWRHDPGGDPPWSETPGPDRVLCEAIAL